MLGPIQLFLHFGKVFLDYHFKFFLCICIFFYSVLDVLHLFQFSAVLCFITQHCCHFLCSVRPNFVNSPFWKSISCLPFFVHLHFLYLVLDVLHLFLFSVVQCFTAQHCCLFFEVLGPIL